MHPSALFVGLRDTTRKAGGRDALSLPNQKRPPEPPAIKFQNQSRRFCFALRSASVYAPLSLKFPVICRNRSARGMRWQNMATTLKLCHPILNSFNVHSSLRYSTTLSAHSLTSPYLSSQTHDNNPRDHSKPLESLERACIGEK